jgi:4a-hydroxytetrahydrobiopterin dehydratase
MKSKNDLTKKRCRPCEGGVPRLSGKSLLKLVRELGPWRISSSARSIECDWVMKDFRAAMDFINKIARLAEREDHHPDIHLTGYRKIKIRLSTHAIGGLSENDFILAAKIDKLPKQLKS